VPGSASPSLAAPTADRRRALLAVFVAYAVALAVALATGWVLRGRSAILVAALADVAATLVVFVFSVRHDNSSVYDPYWSVAPICIAAYWAAAGGVDLRALLVLLLVTTWGIRLTANWVARWRGLQDEDFRYVEIRGKAGRLHWPASLLGIHLLPTAWVFLGMLPTWPALSGHGRALGPLDLAALAVTAAGIAVEAVADRQLRRFLRTREDASAVVDTGLWRLSRHPNYFGEISFWWGLWLFGLAADPRWAWTAVGPLSITVLFLAVSIPWMDRRMRARHPAWAERTASLPALVPWPWRRAGRRLVLVVAALGTLGPAASHAAPPVELRQRWAGEYLFVGGAAERATVPVAVERSVDGMFFIARGIAYDRLLKNCDVCARYTLGFSGGNVSVSGPCQVPDVSPDDGSELDHRNKLGETSKLSQRFVGETLVQEFRGDGGTRKVVWTLLPDGDTLRIQFTITSGHLPRPVDYTLTYRRKGAAPASPDAGTTSEARKPPPG
jgi:steroid 5-alpha reductase family enzyme